MTTIMSTQAPTVIWAYSARHIDNGDGHTACGLIVGAQAHHTPHGTRRQLTCEYCATSRNYPRTNLNAFHAIVNAMNEAMEEGNLVRYYQQMGHLLKWVDGR